MTLPPNDRLNERELEALLALIDVATNADLPLNNQQWALIDSANEKLKLQQSRL